MRDRGPRELTPGSQDWCEALAWASRHFDRSVLILGDMTAPLRPHTRLWSCADAAAVAVGVAVRFEGFASPVVSCAAEDEDSCGALVDAARLAGPGMLVTHESQPLPAPLMRTHADHDPWLTGVCEPLPAPSNICPLEDPAELESFYAGQDMHYWHCDMLQFGHWFGVRDASGTLICAGGVNFVVPEHSYAQLGGLATAAHARGRSHATAVLDAIRSSLAQAGIARCGLFADSSDPRLPGFYVARGFAAHSRFRFTPLR
jgi:GNAT superfamily N-acetyltransferase